jgi:hypothetical protein
MDPAISFLRAHSENAKLIFGSASLLFALDYDPRLLDDPHLGTQTGRRADAVIVDEVYELLYNDWAVVRPEDHRRIMAGLENYQKVYDHGGYRIYLPRVSDHEGAQPSGE